MPIKEYRCQYDSSYAEVTFEVDTDVFTTESANVLLEYWDWDYDEEADEIEEAIRKWSLECFREAMSRRIDNADQLIDVFDSKPEWPKLDGSIGVKVVNFSPFELREDWLTVDINPQH
ncbi:DUF2528 family protein [Limibacter armeniacum]|uniref:DUF2528 family protein n=1 Tax=Limibacter armeniacum TaxID=466084 RepID=UPI002FE50D8D